MPTPGDGWLTLARFHAEARERVTCCEETFVSYSYYSDMEQIYQQRQRMDGSPCTLPANGTMLTVLQSFWNMGQILMLQVKEASNLGFEESTARFK
jgi:hypothetical protein